MPQRPVLKLKDGAWKHVGLGLIKLQHAYSQPLAHSVAWRRNG